MCNLSQSGQGCDRLGETAVKGKTRIRGLGCKSHSQLWASKPTHTEFSASSCPKFHMKFTLTAPFTVNQLVNNPHCESVTKPI